MGIVILSSSVRDGRASQRVAAYLQKYITSIGSQAEIIDLKEENFPIFEERLSKMKEPSASAVAFAGKIARADGVIMVVPEYNGAYPASLKNVIDLLFAEWRRKPVAFAAVSGGGFGAQQVVMQLVPVMWKIGAWVVPAKFHVSKVNETFLENGDAANDEEVKKQVKPFVEELLWCIDRSRG